MVTVYILGEVRLYREGLAQILGRVPSLSVVGVGASYWDAREPLAQLEPQIVLLDMVSSSSVAIARAILAAGRPPKIVALGVPDAEDDLVSCAEAGISGYVTREDPIETLVAVIESVSRGELLTTPRIAAVLLERVGTLAAAVHPHGELRLTPRELEVVELIGDGLSNKAIAQQLRIELPTVKNHVHNILEKLQVKGRADVAVRFRAARR